MIFILQSVWRFIDEFAGKDIDLEIISKFLMFLLPNLIPMVLPLTILVTSIMTFGSFAEQYEFAAMKSAGISLQRAMRSLIVFILVLSGVTYYFSNTVIPYAEGKVINMRKNIAQVKPSMAIVEGAFNDIGSINIKVDDKSGENGKDLDNVIIHKKSKNRSGNHTVIKAERGELQSSLNSSVLSLVLFNGNYYDEIQPKTLAERRRKPFAKSEFDKYVLNIDLSGMNDVDLEDESVKHPYKMLNTSELRIQLDSFSGEYMKSRDRYYTIISQRNGASRTLFSEHDQNTNTGRRKIPKHIQKGTTDFKSKSESDEAESNNIKAYTSQSMDSLFWEFPKRQRAQIFSVSINSVNSIMPQISSKQKQFKNKRMLLNKIEMSLHSKYALPFACVILFFIGAPLGAIIRKGGLGLPMVVAILLFLTYHFIGLFASNSAESGSLSPFLGSWLSTLILFPLSVYLTYRATTDQGFVNLDFITVPIRNLFKKIGLRKPNA